MGINKIMQMSMSNNWAMTDDFQFQFINHKVPLNVSTPLSPNELIEVAVMNVDLPQFSAGVNTVLQGGEYRAYSTKFQPFRITVSFRDVHGLGLKSYFTKIWAAQQTSYFDEIKSTLIVSMNGKVVFHSDACLIDSISQTQVDNTNSQIAEFSVEFVTPFYTNFEIQQFGKGLQSGLAQHSRSTDNSFNIGGLFNAIGKIANIF